MSRGGFKIKPTEHDVSQGDRVSWLDEFADKLASKPKSAVEVARQRAQVSLHDQINSIVGNDPNHRTVESVVKEYQEKVGLAEYLQRVSAERENRKVASDSLQSWDKFGPQLKDDMVSYCRNTIETHRGRITVPAVQHDVLVTFQQKGLQPQDVNTDDVARCISGLIVEELKKYPDDHHDSSDLGRGVGVGNDVKDDDNNDFLSGMLVNIK